MVNVRNPITNEVMSVRGEKTFWVFDEEIGKKRKYLIADYLVDKKPVIEKPVIEKPIVEKPVAEKPAAEKPTIAPVIEEKPPEVVRPKPQKRIKKAQIEEKAPEAESEVLNFGFF